MHRRRRRTVKFGVIGEGALFGTDPDMLLSYVMRREHSLCGADISCMRRYFMGAKISWTQIFHGRRYFMDADISWAQIFHGREYFMGANISWARIFHGGEYFCVNYYFGQEPIFNDFCSRFCPVFISAISFVCFLQ